MSAPFTGDQLGRFIRHQMQWNRYGCCSYDCGPIAAGKKGYVPYDEAATGRRQFMLSVGIPGANKSERRAMARSALMQTHDFLAAYYEEPLSLMETYRGFQEHRNALGVLIADTQDRLNAIIEREQLGLPVFTYVPE